MDDQYLVVGNQVLWQDAIVDIYRLPQVGYSLLAFFIIAIVFGKYKGVGSIVGMLLSVGILFKFVIPQILAGQNPIVISLIAAFGIAILSLYVAHGISKRTTLALISTLITLGLSAVLAIGFVNFNKLSGNGQEEAVFLQTTNINVNLQGLLLGGIIIGALGVLDDITTGQTAAIEEIHKANPNLGFKKLYAAGLSVGQEHIASLVNTLVLAYAGASLPLFLLFYSGNTTPNWVTLNSEFIVEEIVRTIVGSITLILAVPISTLVAVKYYTWKK